ncbi:flagellar hook-length control protein FliK, partial [Cryobacterium fucosi]
APAHEAAAAPATVPAPAGAVLTATPTATPVAAAAAPAPAAPTPAAPLATQVARPLFSLAGAANGDHVLTISVSPDNLGPVTVRAHVNGDNIRVELFAPTDLARDALRAILPDLRRDLSGGGLTAHLDLSGNDSPSDPSANRQDRQRPDARTGRGRGAGEAAPSQFRAPVLGSTHTIDILA